MRESSSKQKPTRASLPAASSPKLALEAKILTLFNDHLSEAQGLPLSVFLDGLVSVIADAIPPFPVALIVWDDNSEVEYLDEPLVSLAEGMPSFDHLEQMISAARTVRGSGWVPLSESLGNPCEGLHIALPLVHNGAAAGCLIAWHLSQSDLHVTSQFSCIAELAPLLTALAQSAVRVELSGRLQRMNSLTQEFFERSDPRRNRWALQWLVVELAKIYQASGATIFLEEEDILLPAASTDPDFERRTGALRHIGGSRDSETPVFYVRGQGLTGWVYEHCRSLRIRDDQDIIRRKLHIGRSGPSHLDHDDRGPIIGQFLGAPLRFGTEAVGVVRLSRRSHLAPFTSADEKMLQFLGDLLGSALGNWRRVNRADAILESINEGIAVSLRRPLTDRIVFANPGIASLLGLSREEFEALDTSDIYAPGEYNKLLPGLRLAKKEAELKGRGEFGPARSVLQRRDGSTVPVMISFRTQPNLLVRPPTYSTIAIARDLSEVEQFAEQHERLLAFLDALEVAYFRADMEGRTIESTSADTRITGFTPEDWNTLKRSVLYEREQDSAKLLDLLRQNNGKLTRHLLELRRKGGELFWAEIDLRLIRDQSGKEIEIEGFYRDVTTQMKMQRFLNDKEDRLIPPDELFAHLKQATEFQIDYTASIGHQIQTPLGSLLGTIENLGRGVLDSTELQRRLRPVIGQLRAFSQLVRNLSYMDMVLRRERVRFQQVSLRRLIHEVEQAFRTPLSIKYLSLVVDMDSIRYHLDIVYGHAELLRQVFANLIDNAIKYSRPHTSIYIRASHLPSGPALDIMNSGLPIPPAERERIFERGVRSPLAQALIPHGTGLGLWLIREILNLHRATIQCLEIEEQSRSFNCFRITFPGTTSEPSSRNLK